MSFNGLEITELVVHPIIDPKLHKIVRAGMMASVQLVLNQVFVVGGIRVIRGKFGDFVSYPKKPDIGPITKDCMEYVTKAIMRKFLSLEEVDAPIPTIKKEKEST